MANRRNSMTFDPHDHRYRCCCGCCHSRMATLVIGVLDAIILGIQSTRLIIGYLTAMHIDKDGDYAGIFWASFAMITIALICVICLFVGVCTERHYFLFPYLAWRALTVIIIFVFIVILVLILVTGSEMLIEFLQRVSGQSLMFSTHHSTSNSPLSGDLQTDGEGTDSYTSVLGAIFTALLVILCIVTILNIWVFLVVRACWKYIKDKVTFGPGREGSIRARENGSSTPLYQYKLSVAEQKIERKLHHEKGMNKELSKCEIPKLEHF